MAILGRFYGIKQAGGLGITILKDGSAAFSYCQVALDGHNLTFEKKLTTLGLNELIKHIGQAVPLSINISGRGVLYKQLERVEEIEPCEFFSSATQCCHGGFLCAAFSFREIFFCVSDP
ncbi:hypothetical protein ACFJIV_14170 [Mucilaginibacter sp. UC70_90]